VRALLGSFAPWRGAIAPRDGLWVYALVLLTIAGLFALALLSEAVLNDGNRLDAMGRSWGFASLSAFVAGWGLALFTNQGALLEELGWRGCGTFRVRSRRSLRGNSRFRNWWPGRRCSSGRA
jgi:hypothetical protein